ncbi:hypothetical protein SuNHUV7_39240 (plasmid) [Pseudoseohaeicola sp. NH-UV-7]|uniref:hypothetical protein n=1 Tax=unclassified Sulfitobacter TaxID=196795 RepID=UPI000E0AA9B8|nr:hypothetical protein [Sulfitobacter sp. JL08]AXI54237.1 hypothetical protein C1J05_06830 [Sulfitobacter sp. JL08]
MERIVTQKTMFVGGKEVHVSERASVADAAHSARGEMKALTDKLGWRIDWQFHILVAEENHALESKLEVF